MKQLETSKKKGTLSEETKEELNIIGDFYREAIYSNNDITLLLTSFSDNLNRHNGPICRAMMSEILHFKELIEARNFFCNFRNWIDELCNILLDESPSSISFIIECRRKSIQSTIRKILRNYLIGKSVNLFDLVAFHIVLDSLQLEDELKAYCYSVKNICTSFFQQKLCVLCTPNKQVGSDPLAKDYIEVPKDNGYKAIHLAYRTQEKEFFEVQIKTFEMYEDAELRDSSHNIYKDEMDKIVAEYIYFNADSVKIPHFHVLTDNSIYDKIGLLDALHIEQLSKTF